MAQDIMWICMAYGLNGNATSTPSIFSVTALRRVRVCATAAARTRSSALETILRCAEFSKPLLVRPAMDDDELQKLYAWIDSVPLSRPKKNLQRDFSDGGAPLFIPSRPTMRCNNHASSLCGRFYF